MNKKQTEFLLSKYVGRDQIRPAMMHFIPMEWNNKKWCAATEGHQFIMVPENVENKLEEPDGKTVDIARVVPEFDMLEEINIILLKQKLDSIQIVEQAITQQCDACDGDGRFEHYGEYYYCKSCSETGLEETGQFEKVPDPEVKIKIGSRIFESKYIFNMMRVVEFTKCQRLELRSQKKEGIGPTIFELGNQIIIGIAALIETEDITQIVEIPTNPIHSPINK